MGALALAQVPDANISSSVTAHQFALVGVDDHIVDWVCVLIVALDLARPGVPDSDSRVFGARHHPFSLAMKCDSGYIVRVSLKLHNRVWVRGFDVVQPYHVPSGCGKILFVRRNA